MNHLTPDQLQARYDDRLDARTRDAADRHLESCEACRSAMAELAASDAMLREVLTHEPGDAYFESFPARVEDRLRAAGLRGAQSHHEEGRWLDWLRSPRRVAWVSGAAVVVVGAALVLITSREDRMSSLDNAVLRERSAQIAPQSARSESKDDVSASAPVGGDAPSGNEVAVPPSSVRLDQDRRTVASKSERAEKERAETQPSVLMGAKPAEEPPANSSPAPFATPPPVSVVAPSADATLEQRSESLAEVARESVAKSARQKSALTTSAQVCGHVEDSDGRPLRGAVVTRVSSGASTTTAADGGFCLPSGSGELSVMAIGYQAARIRADENGEALAVSLKSVDVLGQSRTALGREGAAGAVAPSMGFRSADEAVTLRDSDRVAQLTAAAQSLAARAARSRDAASYDSTAAAWSEVVAALPTVGASSNPARLQSAEARFQAWRLAPTRIRARLARTALESYLARDHSSSAAASARAMLEQLPR
ncbi:MAG: hypothetical protein HOP12_05095 [Candidatus Eisenbacteria bacterium]|uniref:Zinc-finger domain-containing protein n=1 Tax=Eiseniibacteriota bacterium TaxID=2212470 RepID=A0A849SDS9_UNCEI|nr:hypothetical protein [Candidatus Eisenbacteria bacterium]